MAPLSMLPQSSLHRIIWFFLSFISTAAAIHARTHALSTTKEVAICIAGRSRQHTTSAHHEELLNNIHSTMIEPWASRADVFIAIQTDETIAFDSGKSFERFQPIATLHRPSEDNLTALTYHTACMELILAQERKQGYEYRWLLRLRTDVAYHSRLPSNLPAVPATRRVVFVEYCGTGSYPADSNRFVQDGQQCHARSDNGKWGCAKDSWGLVSRSAAPVYFSRAKLDSMRKMANLCTNPSPECRLGCALNSNNVSIYKVKLSRKILRSHRDYNYLDEDVHYPRVILSVR